MAISKEQLASIISGRAKHLCNPEGDKLVEGYTRGGGSDSFNNPNPSDYDYDADAFDRMYLSTSNETTNHDMQYSDFSASNSKLPEKIKRSMLEQRIDTSALGQTSVLDSLGIKPTPKHTLKRSPINEEIKTTSNTSGIDYTIIKAIVNECLKEHFSKQVLNESTSLQTIGLSNGTISLVDNKGNVFKAKLEKIGNTNDKK